MWSWMVYLVYFNVMCSFIVDLMEGDISLFSIFILETFLLCQHLEQCVQEQMRLHEIPKSND